MCMICGYFTLTRLWQKIPKSRLSVSAYRDPVAFLLDPSREYLIHTVRHRHGRPLNKKHKIIHL